MIDLAEDRPSNPFLRLGAQPIALTAAALLLLIAGVTAIAIWRAYTGAVPESDRVVASRRHFWTATDSILLTRLGSRRPIPCWRRPRAASGRCRGSAGGAARPFERWNSPDSHPTQNKGSCVGA